jgi:hypothetical protein
MIFTSGVFRFMQTICAAFFFKPERLEMSVVKEILQLFGEASGLKVNYNMTTAILIRADTEAEFVVKEVLGCQLASFPIKYQGLQLALRPLTKAEWQPLMVGVIHCVLAWQKGMIARAGRLTLIKAVITARPIHQLVVEDAPAWLLEEVTKWLRAFF